MQMGNVCCDIPGMKIETRLFRNVYNDCPCCMIHLYAHRVSFPLRGFSKNCFAVIRCLLQFRLWQTVRWGQGLTSSNQF